MLKHYDKAGVEITEDAFWKLKLLRDYYRVGLDTVGGVEVSTVWLGYDAHAGFGDKRALFETSFSDGGEWHYATLEEAQKGHAYALHHVSDPDRPYDAPEGV